MATLKNKKKLEAVSRGTPEYTKNNQSQNRPNPGMAEGYITQVSEKIKELVNKKLSQEFSRTELRIWVLCLNLMIFFWTHKFGLVT